MIAAALAREVESLLSLPDAVIQLNALIDHPRARDRELAEVVMHDPGLTGRLLKLVNSAYYGFGSRIGSVSHAVSLIGRTGLRKLAMASAMAEVFKGIPPGVVDMETFWFNSVICGSLAETLAERCKRNREMLFISGLLHGIGRLVFYVRRPDEYRKVLALSGDQTERSLNVAERQVFGFDHAELGAELCRQWKLPARLRQILRYHLNPLDAPDYHEDVAILHVAVDMTAGIMPSTQVERYAKDYVPGFVPEVWRELGQPDACIAELLQMASLQSFEVLEVVNPRSLMIV